MSCEVGMSWLTNLTSASFETKKAIAATIDTMPRRLALSSAAASATCSACDRGVFIAAARECGALGCGGAYSTPPGAPPITVWNPPST